MKLQNEKNYNTIQKYITIKQPILCNLEVRDHSKLGANGSKRLEQQVHVIIIANYKPEMTCICIFLYPVDIEFSSFFLMTYYRYK